MESYKPTLWDKLSVEQVKIELMRTAFGHSDTFLSRFDPRMLILWYTFFGIAPWFIYNKTILLGMLVMMVALTYTSKVSTLVLIILGIGLITDTGSILIISFFFGGNLESVWALSTLTLKLLVISLASIAIFASMDPEKFSDAVLSLGMPPQFSFGVSYGYRMLPILIEEYNNLIHSYRLRGRSPDRRGFLKWRYIIYMGKIIVKAFYPLILNTAKRTRTTVEALEVKGFTYAMKSPEAKKLKLAYLKIRPRDYGFVAATIVYLTIVFTLGHYYPL